MSLGGRGPRGWSPTGRGPSGRDVADVGGVRVEESELQVGALAAGRRDAGTGEDRTQARPCPEEALPGEPDT
ncbi:hypothetical protein KC218_24105, partial [Mycobacterium tuberculosis]|nr:hypothetical protein [Mycobacterium tuberculosis]